MVVNDDVVALAPRSAKTGKEIKLAMQELWLTGEILAVGARLVVRHTFQSAENDPLEVIYAFVLPRDAALRRFKVEGEGFSVHSELRPVEEAQKAYEKGIEEGHLSTLAKQYRDGVVNLSLGNLRPGETVRVYLEIVAGVESHDSGIRFRYPFTLAPCYHSEAKIIEVERGTGEIELPEDKFGDLILPRFVADASALHRVGFELSIVLPAGMKEIASPSHHIRTSVDDQTRARVSLATGHALPDRDLVVDVSTKTDLFGVIGGIDKDGKGHFAAIVPSGRFGQRSDQPRRVVFVLDRSGSMNGIPIQQAKRAVEACLGALTEDDSFGIVAFDDKVEVFKQSLSKGAIEDREEARQFLGKIEARGGTELAKGILEAAKLLSHDGGDILLLTDGQVFGTEEILKQARSTKLRIHCLGIGSASQDRFLTLLSRETGGTSRFLTPRERVDLAVVDLFASIGRPVASELKVKSDCMTGKTKLSPQPARAVFEGHPLVLFGETDGATADRLVIEWEHEHATQRLEVPVQVGEHEEAETVRLLHGARLITDIESRLLGDARQSAAEKRLEQRLKKRLKVLSERFGLASRAMALVAVVQREGDRAGEIPQTRVVPVGMPQDTAFVSYFDRLRKGRGLVFSTAGSRLMLAESVQMMRFRGMGSGSQMGDLLSKEDLDMLTDSASGPDDFLVGLAGRVQPDGGLPGQDNEERIVLTLVALLCFLTHGHTRSAGTFRSHVQRLIAFLERQSVMNQLETRDEMIERAIQFVKTRKPQRDDWVSAARRLMGNRDHDWSKLKTKLEENLATAEK